MATFLLTWNPMKAKWDDLLERVKELEQKGKVSGRWSCGNNQHITPGDRVFILRQGKDLRGLFGSGIVTKGSYPAKHWKDSGKNATYILVDWNHLTENPIITRAELNEERFSAINWNTQSSGIEIREPVATALEEEWALRTGRAMATYPDEEARNTTWEGAVYRVVVNAYERDPAARRKCLEHYGHQCSVCDLDIADKYHLGDLPIIHVHHLVPLSTIKRSYKVDAIKDLRPVCPNCHTVIHSRSPCYTIAEMKKMLRR
jgi:5-methylcytosine-specific restriction protein A